MIDGHFHLWTLARGDYPWLQPGMPIYRDYDLYEYRPQLRGIGGAVLVQVAETAAETEFLLEIANASDGLVRGVVGWADLTAEQIAFPADPLLKGVRPMLQDHADTGWVLRPEVLRGLSALRDRGLRLDALVQERHLPILPHLAQAVPGLPVVIDHGAKPQIAAGRFEPWAEGIAKLAAETDWCCKFSGLVTEAGADWDIARLRPYTDYLLRCFGAGRLMFGSDWPVVTTVSSYARWFETAWALVPADDRSAVFGATAEEFYGL